MNSIIWHNGIYKDKEETIFTAYDRIRLGDGVFDTMLVIADKKHKKTTTHLAHIDLHFSRLLHNATIMGIPANKLPAYTELNIAAKNLINENNLASGHYALSTTISHGSGAQGINPPENPQPQIVMRISAIHDKSPPIHAIIAKTVKRNEGSPLSRIKSCNYGDNILALKEAKEKGANEAILLNNKENVACSTTGNIFAVFDGTITTPPIEDGVLNGIARRLLIKKYDVKKQSFTQENLLNAQCIYITNSLRGALPVISLEGADLPSPSLMIDKNFHLK